MLKKTEFQNLLIYILVGIVGCFVVILTVFYLNSNQPKQKSPEFNKELIGKNLSLEKFYDLNNNILESNNLNKGDIIFILVHTGCSACKTQVVNLPEIRKTTPTNTKIYLVGFESIELLNEYSKINNITEPIIRLEGKMLKDLNIKYFPTIIYLNNGVIKDGAVGIINGFQISDWIKEKGR